MRRAFPAAAAATRTSAGNPCRAGQRQHRPRTVPREGREPAHTHHLDLTWPETGPRGHRPRPRGRTLGSDGRRGPLGTRHSRQDRRQQPHSLRHQGSNGARVERGTIVIASFPVCRTPGNNLIFHNFSEALLTLPFLF